MSEKPLENETIDGISLPKPRSLRMRLLLSLFLTAIVTGFAFWSGYSTLRGPTGWVGGRRLTGHRLELLRYDLQKYHDEHGEYPETLRAMYKFMNGDAESDREISGLDENRYNSLVTFYHHPVVYERTETGWMMTVYGADGKPGGIGLDTDFTLTDETDINELEKEFFRDKKYRATLGQVRAFNGGSYFENLVLTSSIFGFFTFLVTLGIINLQKRQHISLTVTAMKTIAIPAIIIGTAISIRSRGRIGFDAWN